MQERETNYMRARGLKIPMLPDAEPIQSELVSVTIRTDGLAPKHKLDKPKSGSEIRREVRRLLAHYELNENLTIALTDEIAPECSHKAERRALKRGEDIFPQACVYDVDGPSPIVASLIDELAIRDLLVNVEYRRAIVHRASGASGAEESQAANNRIRREASARSIPGMKMPTGRDKIEETVIG